MAVKKTITFEGLTYHLDEKDRVAAEAAWTAPIGDFLNKDGYIASGSGASTGGNAGASSGQLFVTSSTCLTAANAAGVDDFLILCVKK